jgi:RNase H-fold protein (predicted Holliday junction resolvase)
MRDDDDAPGPYLALDWGGRKVGYATADERGLVITPRGSFLRGPKRKPGAKSGKGGGSTPDPKITWTLTPNDRETLARLVREFQPETIFLGLPLNADHSESDGSRGARALKGELEAALRLPVRLVPEMLTSWASRGAANEDAQAAALLLEDYFRERAHTRGERG